MDTKTKEQKKKWEKVRIGTAEYCFDDIPAETATFLWLEVVSTFGGSIGSLLKSKESAVDDVLKDIVSSVKPKDTMDIIRQVLPFVFVNESGKPGERATFDHFQGQTFLLFKIMFFALRYNYADFFVDALSHFQSGKEGAQDA
jgi:hypothetical protein